VKFGKFADLTINQFLLPQLRAAFAFHAIFGLN